MRRAIGLSVAALLFAGWACGPTPTPTLFEPEPDQGRGSGTVSVTDSGSSITVTNSTSEALIARVSFVVPAAEEGFVNVCNPYGEPGNREAIAPEEPFSEYDQPLLPGGSLTVGDDVCGPYVGYSVTVRNADGEIVFEEYR